MGEVSGAMGGAANRLSIFLSYRREDTADAAGRLYDALVARFGAGNVFMDVDSIDAGADFAEVVAGALASCDVLLALIGQHWLTVADAQGRPRIEDSRDLVNVELQAALRRGIRVIPVLVQGVTMPSTDQLPDALKELARRNAMEMSATRWNYDLERLTTALRKVQQDLSPNVPPPRPVKRPASRARTYLTPVRLLGAIGAIVVIAGAVVAGVLLTSGPAPNAHAAKHSTVSPSDGAQPHLTEKRSGVLNGIPFTIDYPVTWTQSQDYAKVADFGLPGPGGDDISYISIGTWTVQDTRQQLSTENERVIQTTERHSGLSMTVFDWTNNGDASGLNSNQGHQRLYAFSYRGAAWDVDCGWGTAGPVTATQTSTAESACVAAVDSIEPVPAAH